MKFVVLDGYTLNPGDLSWENLEALGQLKVYDRLPRDNAAVLNAVGDAEVVFTNKTVLSKKVIENAPHLKYIGVLATGYNVVDIEAAKARKIVVTNVPGYSTESVAQMTFALLLELTNKVGTHCISVRSGDWVRSKDFCYWLSPLTELSEKTIGIIGYGQIGRAVTRIAIAFGMKVVVYNRTKYNDTENVQFVSLDELFGQADVISLHCPLTPQNERLIRKENIMKMKPGVLLINTARGGLIDENDLGAALNSGKVGGAALDVVSEEPMQSGNPLLNAKNCIITPHIAWAAKASRERLLEIAVNNIAAYLKGEPVNRII